MDGRRIAFGLAVVSLILPVTNVFVTKPAAALVAASSPPFAWDLETVDANRDTGLSTSVALTDAGVPYISYIDSTQRLLRVAHRTPTNWSSEIVARRRPSGGPTPATRFRFHISTRLRTRSSLPRVGPPDGRRRGSTPDSRRDGIGSRSIPPAARVSSTRVSTDRCASRLGTEPGGPSRSLTRPRLHRVIPILLSMP